MRYHKSSIINLDFIDGQDKRVNRRFLLDNPDDHHLPDTLGQAQGHVICFRKAGAFENDVRSDDVVELSKADPLNVQGVLDSLFA